VARKAVAARFKKKVEAPQLIIMAPKRKKNCLGHGGEFWKNVECVEKTRSVGEKKQCRGFKKAKDRLA